MKHIPKHRQGLGTHSSVFEKFLANWPQLGGPPEFKQAAIDVNDALHVARLICCSQFDTDAPEPADVLEVFRALLRRESELIERDGAGDAKRAPARRSAVSYDPVRVASPVGVVAALAAHFGDGATAAQVLAAVDDPARADLRAAIGPNVEMNPRSLGKALAKLCGQETSAGRLTAKSDRKGLLKYRVEPPEDEDAYLDESSGSLGDLL